MDCWPPHLLQDPSLAVVQVSRRNWRGGLRVNFVAVKSNSCAHNDQMLRKRGEVQNDSENLGTFCACTSHLFLCT